MSAGKLPPFAERGILSDIPRDRTIFFLPVRKRRLFTPDIIPAPYRVRGKLQAESGNYQVLQQYRTSAFAGGDYSLRRHLS